jgi:ABC-2 type transport system ATP-binding protein
VKAARPTVTLRTPRAQALRDALASEGAVVRALGPDRLEVTGISAEQVAATAAGLRIPIFEMTAGPGSLEEAFLRLTAAEGRPG